MKRYNYFKWSPILFLILIATSCSQTRYSSRNYVKSQTVASEKKANPGPEKVEHVETAEIVSIESEETGAAQINPNTEILIPTTKTGSLPFVSNVSPVKKAKKEQLRHTRLKEQIRSNSFTNLNPDQKADGGGLRVVGWLLIILGLMILIFASILIGVLLLLLGLLFVIVGKK